MNINNKNNYLQALYTALHRAKEAILITDDTLRTQYANKMTERLLNMKLVRKFNDYYDDLNEFKFFFCF